MYEEISKTMNEMLNCINFITVNNNTMTSDEAETVYTLSKAIDTLCEVRDSYFLNN